MAEKINELTPQYVEYIPEQLERGVLYISERFNSAIHLCACGCGQQTVTPINKAHGWQFIKLEDGKVSLHPSIGNYAFTCKSHYWVKQNRIKWA